MTDVWDEDCSDYSKNQMDNTDFACRFTKDDIENYILVQSLLLFHYYIMQWSSILSNIQMVA